jgi:hypothetical protein
MLDLVAVWQALIDAYLNNQALVINDLSVILLCNTCPFQLKCESELIVVTLQISP